MDTNNILKGTYYGVFTKNHDFFQSLFACGSNRHPKQRPKSQVKCCFHKMPPLIYFIWIYIYLLYECCAWRRFFLVRWKKSRRWNVYVSIMNIGGLIINSLLVYPSWLLVYQSWILGYRSWTLGFRSWIWVYRSWILMLPELLVGREPLRRRAEFRGVLSASFLILAHRGQQLSVQGAEVDQLLLHILLHLPDRAPPDTRYPC